MFLYLIFKSAEKKLLVLLCFEGMTLGFIFFCSVGYLVSGSSIFCVSLVMVVMLVLDSVFGLSMLLSLSCSSSVLKSYMFNL